MNVFVKRVSWPLSEAGKGDLLTVDEREQSMYLFLLDNHWNLPVRVYTP